MRFILFALFTLLLAGCYTQTDIVDFRSTDPAPQVFVNTQSADARYMPDTGLVQGNLGNFTDINSEAYEIRLDYNHLTTYAYHAEGRVMTLLTFRE